MIILIGCGMVFLVFLYLIINLIIFKIKKTRSRKRYQNRIQEKMRILDELNQSNNTIFGCVFENLGGKPK